MSSAGTSDVDGKPVLSLSYATGPAFDHFYVNDGHSNSPRHNPLHRLDSNPNELTCSAAVPMTEGVNGGEDVTGNSAIPSKLKPRFIRPKMIERSPSPSLPFRLR